MIFSIGVAILSRVGWPDGSFLIDDSVNVFTVAIIWIGAVFALISLGASAEAMLTGRGEYIDRVVGLLAVELRDFMPDAEPATNRL